jgi:hypothetical protein
LRLIASSKLMRTTYKPCDAAQRSQQRLSCYNLYATPQCPRAFDLAQRHESR